MIGQEAVNTGGSSSSRDQGPPAGGDALTRAVRKAIKSHKYHLGKLERAAEELDGPASQDGQDGQAGRETSYTQDSGHRSLQEALNAPLVTARATARSKAQTRPTAAKSGPPRRLQAQDSNVSNASDRSDATMASAVVPPSLGGTTPLPPAVCAQIATIAQDLLLKAQDNDLTKERVLFTSSTLSLAATSS